jgi:(1->4)-alpha-D-glucan 1-alpha-D-glucosylmutase
MGPAWVCTYRLQLNAGFTFADAARIVPYLARLGISHVYLSPILQAAPGSTHGYDVADATKINAELGGEAGYRALCDAVNAAGLGQLLDIVPNHMTTEVPANPWFRDVLQNGPASAYASYFDLRHDSWPMTLPVLGDTLDKVLDSGSLKLALGASGPELRYFDASFPLANGSAPESDAEVQAVNGSPEKLRTVLQRQHYRLSWWRSFGDAPPYRRFFTIQSLIGLRVEDEAVFEQRHKLELSLVAQGVVSGLRVDHIDGLRDPKTYLERLNARAPNGPVVIEKILGPGETLPREWPVEGTTGYDALNVINGLFVHPESEARLTELYGDFTGETRPYEKVLVEAKRGMLEGSFRGELRDLVDLLAGSGDVAPEALHEALRE